MPSERILVIGYGNPGRADDGLGPALAQRLEAMNIPGLTVESDYQLSIEHAAMAAEHDIVLFADADGGSEAPYYLRRVEPAPAHRFTSHGVAPGEVLHLAHSCFNASPKGYLLGMRAEVLDQYKEGLSASAREGLDAALEYLPRFIAANRRHSMQKGKHVILCVDDDPDVLASLGVILASGGYDVVTASTGKEGLKAFRESKPDLVILDLMMEEVDAGTRLLEEMKACDPLVPVFMLSSTGDYFMGAADADGMGLAGVFQKPIDPKILLGLLRAKLERPVTGVDR